MTTEQTNALAEALRRSIDGNLALLLRGSNVDIEARQRWVDILTKPLLTLIEDLSASPPVDGERPDDASVRLWAEQRAFDAGRAWEREAVGAPPVGQDDGMPDGWPDRMEMLGQLMEVVGVYNDGISSPKQLWERALYAAREASVLVPYSNRREG